MTVFMPTEIDTTLASAYEKSYYETVDYVNDMDIDMAKILASADKKSQQKYFNDLSVNSELAENGLKLSVVSAYTQGAIFENSAENLTAKLLRYMGKERLPVSECRLIAMRKLIGIYKLFFGEKTTGILEMPDYIERAEEFSALTGISELEVLNGFKESVYTNDEVRKKVFFIAKELFAEIDKLSSLISKINNTYILLGGSEDLESNFTSEEIRQAIYHSTDFPCAVNILTLIRDTGMLELIK
jgi:hypothetical protein